MLTRSTIARLPTLCLLVVACSETSQPASDAGRPDATPPASCPPQCQEKGLQLCAVDSAGRCVECLKDNHCAGNPSALGNRCDRERSLCRCASGDDCAGNANGSLCHPGALVCSCESDTDCAPPRRCVGSLGGARVCRLLADPGAATPTCATDADCQTGSTCHPVHKQCACAADADCTHKPRTKCALPYAAADYRQCREPCKTDADCDFAESLSRCDPATQTCVQCTSDSECTDETGKRCHPSRGTCVECTTDGDCTAGANKRCLVAEGRCVACTSDADCAGQEGAPRCLVASGTCGCATDGDCKGNVSGPHCDATLQRCGCLADSECTTAPYTVCSLLSPASSQRRCQKPCGQDSDCPSGMICHPSDKSCVVCTTDGDCSGPLPRCLTGPGRCVECLVHADCASPLAPYCSANSCQACTSDQHCATSPEGTRCRGGICSCDKDADCAGLYSRGPRCDTQAGRCQCAFDTDCKGNRHGPVCSWATGASCSCKTDAQCTVPPYTTCSPAFSNASWSFCQTSCLTPGSCPAGLRCKLSAQRCVSCLSNVDCTSSYLARCDLAKNTCELCQSDADCSHFSFAGYYPKVCLPNAGWCVECLSDADCGPADFGGRCFLPFHWCVCATDADCVAQERGHTCDTLMQTCGCHTDQDCPGGRSCSGKYNGLSYCL